MRPVFQLLVSVFALLAFLAQSHAQDRPRDIPEPQPAGSDRKLEVPVTNKKSMSEVAQEVLQENRRKEPPSETPGQKAERLLGAERARNKLLFLCLVITTVILLPIIARLNRWPVRVAILVAGWVVVALAIMMWWGATESQRNKPPGTKYEHGYNQ